NEIVVKLPGNIFVAKSIDSIVVENGEDPTEYPIEFLNSLHPAGIPPHELRLKTGSIVMLLRTLDINNGLCNGVRSRVLRLFSNLLTNSFHSKCDVYNFQSDWPSR